MKKLFKKVAGFAALALAALVPSMSANAATIYLDASAARWTSANLHYWGNGTGDITGEQVTGKSNFFKFTNVPDNQNGSFLFQTKKNEWGNDNASKDASDVNVNVTFTNGHVYKLTAQEGRWKFQDNIFYLYCKLADYSNWDFNNPKATFAFNPDNGYYEAKVTTKAGNNGNYFFISTLNTGNYRSWDSHNNNRYTTGDGDKNPIDTWQTAKIANSGSYLVNGAYTDLLFQFDLDNGKVRAITEVTPPTPGEISWYLDNTKFTKVSDGKFTLTKNMGTSDFHIYKEEGSSKQGYNYNSNTSSGWNINDGDDRQLFENGNAMKMINGGIYVYTIYRDGSNWKMKTVKAGNAPEHVYVIGSIKDNNWNTSNTPEMTKKGSKFILSNVELVNNGDKAKFTLITKLGDNWNVVNDSNRFGPSSKSDTDASTTAANNVKEYKVGTDDVGSAKNWLIAAGTYDLVFDYDALTLTITESGVTPPVQPDNQYYFLGDVNNWMNDGTYPTNGKEYGYGYSKAENGVRADYQFVPTTLNDDSSWFVLDLSKTKTGGNLWGQFIIVQDKGVFQPAKLEENQNDGRDVINWKGNWEQWSNDYDRIDKNNYLKETVKAYKDVPSDLAARAGVAEKIKRSNFHLDHNLYKGVKIYFNPTTSKIFMTYSDYQDFYIYLSTDADRKENGDRKVNVIKESMNNDNYTLDFSSLRVVNSNGTLESDTNNKMEHVVISNGSGSEGDELPNGLKFTNYWKIKIPNGLEGPSGQKFVVSIDGAQDEGAKAFTSIFLNNLYFIDGVRVFATHSADVQVAAVSYRIYGLPDDGDPENLQIFAADGTQKAVIEDPKDEFGWVDLQWGKFGYHPTSTSWWPEETVPAGYTQKTGFYPSFKDEAKTVYYEVPASHASECIQWKITYGQRPSAANGMKKTRTGVQLNPATADLTVDRSDLNADWVLNGRHKELVIGVATGVEDIEMEDGEISEEGEVVAPVYYNLQGVRVAEPQHGLYIKVTGNKSEKILVK